MRLAMFETQMRQYKQSHLHDKRRHKSNHTNTPVHTQHPGTLMWHIGAPGGQHPDLPNVEALHQFFVTTSMREPRFL